VKDGRERTPARIWKDLAESSGMPEQSLSYYQEESRESEIDDEGWWNTAETRASRIPLEPSWTVVDIGPGPGVMTIPMASRCRSVTAIEASPLMVRALERKMSEYGSENVRVIHGRFEDLAAGDIGEHDVTVASYSLVMGDLEAALVKINGITKRRAHVFWSNGVPVWEKVKADIIWLALGREYLGFPRADLIRDQLVIMGQSPEMEILDGDVHNQMHFKNEQVATGYLKLCLGDSYLPEQDPIIERMVSDHIEGEEVVFRGGTEIPIHISWTPVR